MREVIALPSSDDKFEDNQQFQFGYYETMNFPYRNKQEDALTWKILESKDLTPDSEPELTPIEIGHRLWTSYQLLDGDFGGAGTTASTTVYDGKGSLITATLADAVTFAAIYDKEGNALGVVRLNSITHKPGDELERKRVEAVGHTVEMDWGGLYRVNGILAVSRAIGDFYLKKSVCSYSTIDITNVGKIAEQLNIHPENIGKIQVISTCDGFTDGAGFEKQTKEDHEQYLLASLQEISMAGKKTEMELAQLLMEKAKHDGSSDNIGVAIQTVTEQTPAFILGIYDGHGGVAASIHTAENIGRVFIEQCTKPRSEYEQQELSVQKKETEYKADNPDLLQVEAMVYDAVFQASLLNILPEQQSRESAQAVVQIDVEPVAVPTKPAEATEAVKPIETAVIAPVDAAVIAPVDAAVIAPVDAAVIAPVDAAVIAPVDAVVIAPVDAAVTAPVDAAVTAPVDAAVTAPVDAAVIAPVDAAVTAPVDAAVTAPVDAVVTAPVDAVVTAPVDVVVTAPVDVVVTAPVDVVVTAPVDAAVIAPVDAAEAHQPDTRLTNTDPVSYSEAFTRIDNLTIEGNKVRAILEQMKAHITKLYVDAEVKDTQLVEAMNATFNYLTGPKTQEASNAYQAKANDMQGHSHTGLKVLGGLMLALAIAALVLGVVFFPAVVGAAAVVVGAAAATGVAATTVAVTTASFGAAAGFSFFASRQQGLSKDMSELYQAEESRRLLSAQ